MPATTVRPDSTDPSGDIEVTRADPAEVTRLIGFAQAARGMSTATDLDEALRGVVEQTALTFTGVGVSLVLARPGGRPGTTMVSQAAVGEAEALQLECSEGPSYWVLQRGTGIRGGDVRFDPRWRFWGPRVASLGFRSFASVPVWDGAVRGVLSAYALRPSMFSADDLVLLEVYAVHVSVALASARERRASQERGITAQAEGMLMERFEVDSAKASSALRLLAARYQTDPASVARQLVEHRTLTPPQDRRVSGVLGVPRVAVADRAADRVALSPAVRVRAWIRKVVHSHSPVVVAGVPWTP